jgi:Tol biopolymer transport system component
VQTAYHDPVLSPDGRFVAYGGDGDPAGETGIIVLDRTEGTRTQLTTDGAGAPIWSADSRRILAFAPSRLVVIIDVSTGTIVGRIEDTTVQEVIGWTADGASILYGSCEPGCGMSPVSIAGADGSGPRPYDGPLPDVAGGIPSPDALWIGLVHDNALYVSSEAGGAEERVSPGGLLVLGDPTWSPGGDWLAFAAKTGAESDIRLYVVPRTGGEAVPISSGPTDFAPSWQPIDLSP